MSAPGNNDLPRPANGERVYLDELAIERNWSRRKLEYIAASGRLIFWQDVPRGRRYTTRAEVDAFDRKGLRGMTAHSLAAANEGRIEKLETQLAELNREIRQIRERVMA